MTLYCMSHGIVVENHKFVYSHIYFNWCPRSNQLHTRPLILNTKAQAKAKLKTKTKTKHMPKPKLKLLLSYPQVVVDLNRTTDQKSETNDLL